jgi:SAM-dependent methyltransferase
MSEQQYFAATADSQDELGRLRLIEQELDPDTIRYLTKIGVGEGWRCLEVGPGGGSITRWLAERVGPSGQVVAADIDPRFLDDLDLSNVEVRRHNIAQAPLETDLYDLVHCRLLLMHMADPNEVLRRMVNTLRPGGWILAEEPDNGVAEAVSLTHPLAENFNSCYRAKIESSARAKIMDLRMGRSLPEFMARLDLVDTGNEGVARVIRGGEPLSLVWVSTWKQVDEQLVDEGVLTKAEVDDMARAYQDPSFSYRAQLMQAVWGRRPPN